MDYSKLDDAIVASVRRGDRTFTNVWGRTRTLAEEVTKQGSEPERMLDRRMQALRKKGVIAFGKGGEGWYVVKADTP